MRIDKTITKEKMPLAQFLERWLSLTQDEATFQAWFSSLRTCNSRLQNTGEPLPRDTGMITQNVTLSDAEDCKIQKRNKIEILGSR